VIAKGDEVLYLSPGGHGRSREWLRCKVVDVLHRGGAYSPRIVLDVPARARVLVLSESVILDSAYCAYCPSLLGGAR
jgi:hypothetical protein